MGIIGLDKINAETAKAKIAATAPATPMSFYGETAGQDPIGVEWKGGELYWDSTDYKLYVQTATSGRSTGTWVATEDAFVTTSTTTTSTTTSTTSTTTSTTSTSTSTTTTTSSSTSTTTTTSSTTTA